MGVHRSAQCLAALGAAVVIGTILGSPAGASTSSAAPTQTYTSGKTTLTCTASSCTLSGFGLGLDMAGIGAAGPGHYQGEQPAPKRFSNPGGIDCPGVETAKEHIDIGTTEDQAVLTISLDSLEVNCITGEITAKAPAVLGPFTLNAPVAATTTTASTSTTTTAATTTTTTTIAAPAADDPRPTAKGLSSRQRRSLAAVRRGERSRVTAALASPAEALDAERIVKSGLLAGALVLLLVFPSELFNSTYEKHHVRVEAAIVRLPWRPGRHRHATPGPVSAGGAAVGEAEAADESGSGRARRAMRYLVVLAAGAVIAGFLDPEFGLDQPSVALVLGVMAASLAGTAISSASARTYRQIRKLPTASVLEAVPSGLVIAAVGVVVSRLVHFEPGYLYGLVGGVAFAVNLDRRDAGRAQFTVFMTTLVVALAAWFAFVPVSEAANEPGASIGVTILDAVLAALFITAVERTLFSLAPLRFLPGRDLSEWSWWAWGAIAAVASFLFVDVLLRPESGYLGQSTTASAVVVYGLFALFGVASVAFWAWFRLRPDDPNAVDGELGTPAAPATS